MTLKRYAGIGPRKTPFDFLPIMTHFAGWMCERGWTLRSGHGDRADQAFELGSLKANKEVMLPWMGFNNSCDEPHYIVPEETDECIAIAKRNHRYWDALDDRAKSLMCRNVNILLGADLSQPVLFVCYWQPPRNNIDSKGGTNHSLRVARDFNIPTYNLNIEHERNAMIDFIYGED